MADKIGDLWRTPRKLFNTLDREFTFVADMAASEGNALCDAFLTEEDDSLSCDWHEMFNTWKKGSDYVWLNPPYSNPMPWVKKSIEAQSKGLGVVMLLNADPSVGWFSEALKGVSEIRYILGDKKEVGEGYHSGRIAFLNGEGDPISGNSKPQFVLIFNPFKIGERVTSYVKRSEFYK